MLFTSIFIALKYLSKCHTFKTYTTSNCEQAAFSCPFESPAATLATSESGGSQLLLASKLDPPQGSYEWDNYER